MAPPTESQMLAAFDAGYEFPPLRLRRVTKVTSRARRPDSQNQVVLEISGGGLSKAFDAEFKTRSSPRIFAETILRITEQAPSARRPAILVVPYLSEPQLDELQRRGLSGIDLSGNGVVSIADKLLVYRTGQPNRFPDSRPTKFAYRGATSLVARVFLCRYEFSSLSDIEQEIVTRGGKVVLSTISKALKRLEEDLIIERTANRIRLRQADELLDNLARDYSPPRITSTVTLSIPRSAAPRHGDRQTTEPVWKGLLAKTPSKTSLTLSGRSSIEAYAVMGRQKWPACYTPDIARQLRAWRGQTKESSRFIDLELNETNDPTVYFDTRQKRGVPYASPIQTYLECVGGDKREQETAADIRRSLLAKINAGDTTA